MARFLGCETKRGEQEGWQMSGVRAARHIGSNFMAGLKSIVGGDINQYAALMNDTRQQAIDRMVLQAEAQGANAIIGMRLATSEISQGCSELCAYGTAVVIS